MTGGPYEVEVKFVAADPDALARRLDAAGAALAEPRGHEMNVLFDDEQRSLLARGMLLRLRQDRAARITLKAPAPGHAAAGAMKVREELEVTLDDGARMQVILERLGYHVTFRYEKFRTTYRLGDCMLMLDETPLGTFLELEGAPDAVRATAATLQLDWEQRLVEGYATLFFRARARLAFSAADMTFADLAGLSVPPGVLHP